MSFDQATPGESEFTDPDEQAIWWTINDLYAAYLEHDRPRLEAHLDASCTLWDSALPQLRTKSELQAARQDKPVDLPEPARLEPSEGVIRVWGETAMLAHRLQALFDDPALNQDLRCTSVLRRIDGDWKFVHHHEEVLAGAAKRN